MYVVISLKYIIIFEFLRNIMSECNNLNSRVANESFAQYESGEACRESNYINHNKTTPLDYIEVLSKLHKNQIMVKFHIVLLTFFNALYLAMQYFYFWNSFTVMYIALFGFTYFISWACMYFMKHMADLHVKLFVVEQEIKNKNKQQEEHRESPRLDLVQSEEVIGSLAGLILYSVIVQMLSLYSNYFWLLLLIKIDYIYFFSFMREQTRHLF